MAGLLKAAEVKLDRIRQHDPTLPGISIEALPGKDITHTVTDGGATRFEGLVVLPVLTSNPVNPPVGAIWYLDIAEVE